MSNPGVSRPSLAGLKILIVEDEPDARDLLVVVLQQYGAKTLALDSTKRALEVLEHWKPDVVVSDIGMPEQDGYELIRHIRSLPAEHGGHTPAAALTAFTTPEDRLRALASGYQMHISKPFELTALAAAMQVLPGGDSKQAWSKNRGSCPDRRAI